MAVQLVGQRKEQTMRLIDADWLSESIDAWRATLEATYGKNDEYVLCLGEVLGKIENAPTISAEPTVRIDGSTLIVKVDDVEPILRVVAIEKGSVWGKIFYEEEIADDETD